MEVPGKIQIGLPIEIKLVFQHLVDLSAGAPLLGVSYFVTSTWLAFRKELVGSGHLPADDPVPTVGNMSVMETLHELTRIDRSRVERNAR